MNYWTNLSIEYANQRNYLDELFRVYPTIPEGIREIDEERWIGIQEAFNDRDDEILIKYLLHLDLFPIKDSYVAFLKRDPNSIKRNPKTVQRLCGRLYEMGLDKIYEKCSEPKETNRQIGPLFKRWVNSKALGITPVKLNEFSSTSNDAILDASDSEMQTWAKETIGYDRKKGLDFVGRFNGKYVIGEAKFLTDFGGHQNAQFDDAVSTMTSAFHSNVLNAEVIPIAIMDGVLYIKGNNKLYRYLENHEEQTIISSLLLREYLYSL